MLDFNYFAPTYYEFGKDKEKEVSNLIKKFGGSKVLIHYGSGSVKESGLLDKVKSYLDNSSISYIELGGVVANPESDLVYKGIELCRENKVDFILAIGGGSVIDSSKAIAAGCVYDGDFWDYFRDDDRLVIDKTLPVGVILTIAAAGSESSNSIVITNSGTRSKRGNVRSDAVRPKFAIMNPCLTMTLPSYQAACGIVDIMTHVIERYFSNTEGCVVTDNLCIAILKSMLKVGKIAIDNPSDYGARANIMWASSLAHNNLCGVDREQDWASHKIEHELSGKYGIAHGAGLSVIVINWMKYVSKKNPSKFLEFSKNLFDIDNIDEGINRLQDFWISLGMPSSLEELGYKESDLDYLVDNVDYTKDGYIGNYVRLEKKDVRCIYEG
jgi:hypothetical protein